MNHTIERKLNKNYVMRDSQTAFENAIDKGLMNDPEYYMYMYTKTKEDGTKTYDIFNHIWFRNSVEIEADEERTNVH